jgi:hypothetical protein
MQKSRPRIFRYCVKNDDALCGVPRGQSWHPRGQSWHDRDAKLGICTGDVAAISSFAEMQ